MTMTDYGLMTVSAAAILIIASYWWRRAPEAARIFVTEIGWWGGSFFAAMYVWIELTSSRPLASVADRTHRADRDLARCPAAARQSQGGGPRGGRGAAPRG